MMRSHAVRICFGTLSDSAIEKNSYLVRVESHRNKMLSYRRETALQDAS